MCTLAPAAAVNMFSERLNLLTLNKLSPWKNIHPLHGWSCTEQVASELSVCVCVCVCVAVVHFLYAFVFQLGEYSWTSTCMCLLVLCALLCEWLIAARWESLSVTVQQWRADNHLPISQHEARQANEHTHTHTHTHTNYMDLIQRRCHPPERPLSSALWGQTSAPCRGVKAV